MTKTTDAPEPPESDVLPDEFTRGIQTDVAASPLPAEVVEQLGMPLDPNRVRTRKGRGRAQFSYLAGHDVKRRAAELFGFGNWGYEILELAEIAAVPVASEGGAEGWHVAYRAIVQVTVRGCFPFSDVGYGDGVEYGAAARVQACELATKEAVTDAMKRAFTGWGDQFGLVLYAKADEVKRGDRDRNADGATARRPGTARLPEYRQEYPDYNWPENWGDLMARTGGLIGADEAAEWLRQATEVVFPGSGGSLQALASKADRDVMFRKASGVLADLDASEFDLPFAPEIRAIVGGAWSKRLDGQLLTGPLWRLSPAPSEAVYPEREPGAALAPGFGSPIDEADVPEFGPEPGEPADVTEEDGYPG